MSIDTLQLYHEYRQDDVHQILSKGNNDTTLYGGQWQFYTTAIVCFAEIGDWQMSSHFMTGARFCWKTTAPYTPQDDEYLVPKEVRGGAASPDLPVLLFARRSGHIGSFLYLGHLEHTYGYSQQGADYVMKTTLPSAIWSRLGGWQETTVSDEAINTAMRQLQAAAPLDDRLGVLKLIAEYWNGPFLPDHGIQDLHDESASPLPSPLRWWYNLAGNRLHGNFNRFVLPHEVEMDNDGRFVFLVECQGVYLWATEATSSDPAVWGRYNEPGEPWHNEGMLLSEFLIQECIFEGLMFAPYHGQIMALTKQQLDRILAPLTQLPFQPWHWPSFPLYFYAGHGVFAQVHPENNSYTVEIGAHSEIPLQYLTMMEDLQWEHKAF